MSSRKDVLFCHTPAEFPDNASLIAYPSLPSQRFLDTLEIVRPDLSITNSLEEAQPTSFFLFTGVDWRKELSVLREQGLRQQAIVASDVITSYFDWHSFPIQHLKRGSDGGLEVSLKDFTAYVNDFGPFFGHFKDQAFVHEPVRYQQASRAKDEGSEAIISKVLDRLGDDESRADLKAVLYAAPQDLWVHWVSRIFSGVEYFDYAVVKEGDTVLNCGVHGGGEIAGFVSQIGPSGTLVNIDPLGHKYLHGPIPGIVEAFDGRVVECPVAINNKAGTVALPVEEGGMAGSYAIDKVLSKPNPNLTQFRGDTIDTLVKECGLDRVDYIKMDIEGAEPFAIEGAMETIRTHRPSLGLSIYHGPEHFWEIPYGLMQDLEDYDFFVRNYHFISNETLLYAIPKERERRARNRPLPVSLKID